MPRLQEVLEEHEKSARQGLPPFPSPLPPCHLSEVRAFKTHARALHIEPRYCEVFKENLVYLYYGGLFFRSSRRPTRNAGLYPVGFLFTPESLSQVERYYPFDTGAIAEGYYGPSNDNIELMTECCLSGYGPSLPCLLVRHLFGSNRRYLKGLVSQAGLSLFDPVPWLIRHLTTDYSELGTDQRQYRIECQSRVPMSFAQLLWVGYPDVCAQSFGRIFESAASKRPVRYVYDYYNCAAPAEIAAILQQRAVDFIRAEIDESI